MNQMFRDKLFLVMLVLGLLTMVAAAGVVTIRRGNGQEQKPYVDMQGQDEYFAEEAKDQAPVAGNSNAENSESEITQEEQILAEAASNQDNAADEQGHIAEEAGTETENGQNTGLAANGTKDDGADPAVREAGAGGSAATALVLNFADTSKMLWPARGNVLLDYSMDSTIYFPTLEQYKCNPGLVIQSEVSTPVNAPAAARVLEVGNNEEIGDKYRAFEIEYICDKTVNDPAYAAQEDWLMMGDFNARSRVDNWFYNYPENDTRLLVHDHIRNNTDLVDIIAERNPGRFISSTYGNARIDFMYASPSMYGRVANALIVIDKWTTATKSPYVSNFYDPSDHRPILVDFELK